MSPALSHTDGRPFAVEERPGDLLAFRFEAFAGPCEVVLPAHARANAQELGAVAAQEAWRVEHKLSRYRDDSVLAWIHRSRVSRVKVDQETASLLDSAKQC